MAARSPKYVAVALDGAGAHPGAWRASGLDPREVLAADYWTSVITEAEAASVDAVTIDDSFLPATGVGRLDAVLIASRVAPLTRRIGLIPTATVPHTEPFHVSKAIATLDFVSAGRAGVVLRVSADATEAEVVGRRPFHDDPPSAAELLAEARDYAQVLRFLWDSWEDDAEIRDVASGRFIDRNKLHYADFAGEFFSVRGPSITPRPPQGRPLIAATGVTPGDLEFLGSVADVAFLPAATPDRLASAVAAIRAADRDRTATDDQPVILVDLDILIDETDTRAADRLGQLDELALVEPTLPDTDRVVVTGSPTTIADRIEELVTVDGIDGVRLHPAELARDLRGITGGVLPELRRRNLLRDSDDAGSLRARFGRARPRNLFTTDPTTPKAATV